LAAAHLVEAAVLRGRRRALTPLDPPAARPADGQPAKLGVVAAEGITVDDATRAAVAQEMDLDGVEVIDLVPGDLPAERALRLLRRVDPARVATDVMYAPGGAHEALTLHPSLVERMQVELREQVVDRHDLARRTVRAQRYAPTTAALRVAPDLAAGPFGPEDRWRELVAVTAPAYPYASLPPAVVAGELAQLAALVAGAVVAPLPALAALAAWSAKPALVFGVSDEAPAGDGDATEPLGGTGTALRPPDVGPASLLRLPRALATALRTAAVGARQGRATAAARRAEPPVAPPDQATLWEDPVDHCVWCGSERIVGRLDTDDLFQHKPGHFHLDVCEDCGHIFQNPRLTTAGLDYYYADFYEGLGEELWEVIFGGGGPHNDLRCDAIARANGNTVPQRWLDVGAGHGHFCLSARQRWPETRFEGVDMGEGVEEAARRGRIDVAHQGLFTELAEGLPRPYDVVSMHHYLEHTLDPKQELAAAASLLAPGGHLMIEVPDASTPWATRLGRFWYYWAQPQHLHFIRAEAMVDQLTSMGLEVVSVERAEATLGFDVTGSVAARVQSWVPSSHMPWYPPPGPLQRVKRMAAMAAAGPVMAGAVVFDMVKDAVPGREGANAYRVVARAPGSPVGAAAEGNGSTVG
jgi:SAM-dependent methyltransferase